MINDKHLKTLIIEETQILNESTSSLQKSNQKCLGIGIKENYTFEEQESFDSLTSKFARTSDIYTQKLLKSLLIYEREDFNSFIDKANKAEKLDMVPSARKLIEIRDLRNEIAHEYFPERLNDLYSAVFNAVDSLLLAIKHTMNYIEHKTLIS